MPSVETAGKHLGFGGRKRWGVHSSQEPSLEIIVGCDLFILDSEGLLKTKEKNQKLYTRAQRHQEKKEKIQRHNRKLGDLVEKKTTDLRGHYERLANLRRSHILELTSVISPIEEVKTSVRYGTRVF